MSGEDNPTSVLIDVSGSQVGTQTNPFFISGTLQFPGINIVNNNYVISGADQAASYVLNTLTASLPGGVQHETLQQLIHLSDDDGPRGSQWASGLVKDTGPTPFPTASIWWTDSSRTKKVVDSFTVRNAYKLPITTQWKAYASDGITVVESYTDTITYQGVFEISRTRSKP